MGLETASYVSQLNGTNPVSTDGLAQADDHMRLIKTPHEYLRQHGRGRDDRSRRTQYAGWLHRRRCRSQHPRRIGNANCCKRRSSHEHRSRISVSGATSNIQAQLDAHTGLTNYQHEPPVCRSYRYGDDVVRGGNAIPTGYALCDGGNGTPDLRDRFVVGAGTTYAVADTGGAASVTLTEAEIPAHTHTYSDQYVLQSSLNPGIDIDFNATTWNPNGNRTRTSDLQVAVVLTRTDLRTMRFVM